MKIVHGVAEWLLAAIQSLHQCYFIGTKIRVFKVDYIHPQRLMIVCLNADILVILSDHQVLLDMQASLGRHCWTTVICTM